MIRIKHLALAVAGILTLGGFASADEVILATPSRAAVRDSSSTKALELAAADYQAAWKLRQTGPLDEAEERCQSALSRIEAAIVTHPPLSERLDLVALRGRVQRLIGDVRKDRLEVARNEPDDQLLNAPATEPIEPQWNAQVAKWVDFFCGAGRSTFERWLKRSGRYMELFRAALQKEGLPPDLVHLVFVESGFNMHARSVSAAVGPWQFLRSTGRLFGLTVNQWVDERKDPEKSTVAAARYLKHLYAIFGDWPLALASYNAGEGTVLRAIKRQGTDNYWDLKLPRQTEDYVPQFMAILAISRDPSRYGFDAVDLDDPVAFDEVAFKGAVDLRAIAKLTDCTVPELKELNPAIVGSTATGHDGVTTLRVPDGKGETLMEKIQEGAKLPAVNLTVRHRVRRGETLQGIANKYHVSGRQLAASNGISAKAPLRIGATLKIPASHEPPTPLVLAPGDPRGSTAYVPSRNRGVPVSMNANSEAEGRTVHTVKRGQTLGQIATQYGVTIDDLKRWNRLKTASVRRGTRLKIRMPSGMPTIDGAAVTSTVPATSASYDPTGAALLANMEAAAGDPQKPARPKTVVVKRGDTLTGIAREHGVTVKDLQKVNGMRSSRVLVGQKLKVPGL